MALSSNKKIEQFIELVRGRQLLWDSTHREHRNRHVANKIWSELSQQMQIDEYNLRKKWKYLRDQFAVELGKIVTSADTYEPKWPYFQSLQFLKFAVTPRCKTAGSTDRSEDYVPESEELTCSVDSFDAIPQQDPFEIIQVKTEGNFAANNSLNTQLELPSTTKSRKRQRDDDFGQERQRQEEADEHLHFFKSLLPHIRKIPDHKLLTFRNRIQDVVEKFAYPELEEEEA